GRARRGVLARHPDADLVFAGDQKIGPPPGPDAAGGVADGTGVLEPPAVHDLRDDDRVGELRVDAVAIPLLTDADLNLILGVDMLFLPIASPVLHGPAAHKLDVVVLVGSDSIPQLPAVV